VRCFQTIRFEFFELSLSRETLFEVKTFFFPRILPPASSVAVWMLKAAIRSFRRLMKFALDIGQEEKHTVEFSFNQLLGRSAVKVDGYPIFRKARWFSEPLTDEYEFEIGRRNPVYLRIEKERKLLMSSKYRVYVDNRLVQLHQGI
jgi:hypothetical protein